MKAMRIIPFLIVLALLSACTPKPEQLAPYIEQTVQAIPTHTAYPTNTPYATHTAYPTYTKPPTTTPIIKLVTPTYTFTPIYTATATIPPTETPKPSPTPDPLKTNKKPGIYLVNVTIAPGVWLSLGTGNNCYWEITTRTGDIINNHFGMAGGTCYIPPSAFQVTFKANCGDWQFLEEP